MERFFLVAYFYDGLSNGNCTITTDGGYINKGKTIEFLKDNLKTENVVIINIVEMNKRDYLDFTYITINND